MSDTDPYHNMLGYEDQPPKKKRGCLFWGCLSVCVLFLLIGGCVGLGFWKIYQLCDTYTSTEPADISIYEASPDEVAALETRTAMFCLALQENLPAELVLTTRDLNVLAASSEWAESFPGQYDFRIIGDEVQMEVSIPVKDIEDFKDAPKAIKRRYLNGVFSFDISFENNRPKINVSSISANGHPLPEAFTKELQLDDLVADGWDEFLQDDQNAALAERIDDIQVRDGMVVISGKGL